MQSLCLVAWGADLTTASLLQLTGAVGAALVGGIVPGLVVAAQDPVSSLLAQVREVLGLDGVGLFIRSTASGDRSARDPGWQQRAGVGSVPASPDQADVVEPVDERTVLALRGPALPAEQRRLLRAFAAQLVTVRDRQRLVASLDENRALVQDNQMRTSILQAVSHDLRTPLAGIKLVVSSLLQPHARFDPGQRRELLDTIEVYADQFSVTAENLLDLSRITGGAVGAVLGPVRWHDVLPGALRAVPADVVDAHGVQSSAAVVADAGLVERVLANLAENAVRRAPGSRITVAVRDLVEADGMRCGELRVIDTGSASSAALPEDLEEPFIPFQRFGDAGGAGTGLVLAVARGLTEAMGGTLHAELTPGSGLTMVLRLPAAGAGPGPDGPRDADEEGAR